MTAERLLEPLAFRNLTVRNRVLRSSIAGRFDNYDGGGSDARISFETRFARGRGRRDHLLLRPGRRPRTDRSRLLGDRRDERIPFWRELGERVHEHGCPYIVQLAHGGRQRDIGGIEFAKGLSSTDKADPLHGFPCEAMTQQQIDEVVSAFARAAHRVREAGLDGVEIHGANGYLFTQFLSSAANDRKDDYGGSLENRARLLLDVVRAIRAEVGATSTSR